MEKNFGGWLAAEQSPEKVLGILARRTEGIVTHKSSFPDETDGLQVVGNGLTRSALDWHTPDVRRMVDREILAGNVFRLEALLALKDGAGWQGIDKLRQEYAAPPAVSIDAWTMGTGVQ